MKYRYKVTKRAQKLLLELKALKIVFEKLPYLPHIEERLRRESLLKSSLFSARIEGNPLTLPQVEFLSPSRQQANLKRTEVFNILKAYRYLYFGKTPKKISFRFISKLHQLVMDRISFEAGQLRQEPWAIFNQAGVAVYLAPVPFRLPELMKEFIEEANSLVEEPAVKAGFFQFIFEKIHPFADGNGRVGRLISAYILKNGQFGLRGLVSFEEYIDEHREVYYQVLEPNFDASKFIEFFLESLVAQANLVLEKLKNQSQELPEDILLPRRREILEIIKDHPFCSFDFISRRFPTINPKTLHYDLKKLQEKGFIIKVGKTRGSVYKAK